MAKDIITLRDYIESLEKDPPCLKYILTKYEKEECKKKCGKCRRVFSRFGGIRNHYLRIKDLDNK